MIFSTCTQPSVTGGPALRFALGVAIILLVGAVDCVATKEASAASMGVPPDLESHDLRATPKQTPFAAPDQPVVSFTSEASSVVDAVDAVDLSAWENRSATWVAIEDAGANPAAVTSLSRWLDVLDPHRRDAAATLGPKLTGILITVVLAVVLAAVLRRVLAGFRDSPRSSWALFTLAAVSSTGCCLFAYNPAHADLGGLAVAIAVSVVVSAVAGGIIGHWWSQEPPAMQSLKVGFAAIVPAGVLALALSLPDEGSGDGAFWPFALLGICVGVIGAGWLLVSPGSKNIVDGARRPVEHPNTADESASDGAPQ